MRQRRIRIPDANCGNIGRSGGREQFLCAGRARVPAGDDLAGCAVADCFQQGSRAAGVTWIGRPIVSAGTSTVTKAVARSSPSARQLADRARHIAGAIRVAGGGRAAGLAAARVEADSRGVEGAGVTRLMAVHWVCLKLVETLRVSVRLRRLVISNATAIAAFRVQPLKPECPGQPDSIQMHPNSFWV